MQDLSPMGLWKGWLPSLPSQGRRPRSALEDHYWVAMSGQLCFPVSDLCSCWEPHLLYSRAADPTAKLGCEVAVLDMRSLALLR